MIALRKRAEVDSKYFLIFIQNDALQLTQSLDRLGSALAELANIYYRDEGRRIKTRIEKKNFNFIELNIRYCFKVAVYAEFRRDWVEALRFYEDAYRALREMVGTSTRLPAIQRLVEIKTVVELLHFKISTLLLHGGKVKEAVMWFQQHIASYKTLVGAPEVVFLHWDWMSQQYLVFAELLETSAATIPSNASLILGTSEKPLTEWEFQPAYYYELAAHYMREKRCCLEIALSASETSKRIESSSESVIQSVFVGQFARLLEQGEAFAMQTLTDAEYVQYALAEGKRFQDSYEIIALLKKSFESYSNLNARRMASYCGNQMAREYFTLGEFGNAKSLFDGGVSLYRQEGWITLLWEVLGYLRECSRRLGSVKDFIEFSLEMAALPILSGAESSSCKGEYGPAGPPTLLRREMIHKEVFGLVKGEPISTSNEGSNIFAITEDEPLHLEIDLVSPLRVVLLASVAFHDQAVKPGAPVPLTLSLLSQLPHPVEIDQLEIQFNQSECNFTIASAPEETVVASSVGEKTGIRLETAPNLSLVTNKWLRLTFDIISEQSGKLECLSVIAKLGRHLTICCRAESPASMDDLPLWKFEDLVQTFPTRDPALAFSGQKVVQVEEPDPQVDLVLGATGPALVGERFLVPVTVTSKGHPIYSGELKINLVDARGGGLVSPRETEPFSMDSHHVELVGISEPDGENESEAGMDNIKKIQQSFGLLPIPFIKLGDSWCCKLEIKWNRPKPIMLYVSLGYLPNSEAGAQKFNVHKSIQIEGKTAVVMDHRFMLPYRRHPLLLSKIKLAPDSDHSPSLALNETSFLIVSAKNCSDVPLRLMSMSIEKDDDEIGRSCTVHQGGDIPLDDAFLVPGEEFRQVFSIIPELNFPRLALGAVSLRWSREFGLEEQSRSSLTATGVLTRHKLPDVNVEMVPIIVSLECPPQAILGSPFTCYVRIKNQTELLQEVKYSLADSQSFVLSGFHNDTIFVLPKSEHIVGYKLVPLVSGLQQLPRFTVTSLRYSAELQPSLSACTIFVFPGKPQFMMDDVGSKLPEPIAT
ncbi:trafficking protein particle complex subunit 11-like isoform X2 [Macadamia integrifolia]|nr:trafficking protein particle complex subunit 11-like isoform X2 [Macadamia integrifolia]